MLATIATWPLFSAKETLQKINFGSVLYFKPVCSFEFFSSFVLEDHQSLKDDWIQKNGHLDEVQRSTKMNL